MDRSAVDVDTQPRWYQHGGGGSSDTGLRGTIDVPEWMTERRCLDWNYTADPNECEEYETTEEMKERVAEEHLVDVVTYRDGSDYRIPPEAWAEVVG